MFYVWRSWEVGTRIRKCAPRHPVTAGFARVLFPDIFWDSEHQSETQAYKKKQFMASSKVVMTLWRKWSEWLLPLDEMVLCFVTSINQVDATILWQMIERKRSTSWFLKITMMVLLTIILLLTQTGELLLLWHSFSSFNLMFFLRSMWRVACQSRLPV